MDLTDYKELSKSLNEELLRVRTTEHASAHALDRLRQFFGLDLIRDEHPSCTAKRIENNLEKNIMTDSQKIEIPLVEYENLIVQDGRMKVLIDHCNKLRNAQRAYMDDRGNEEKGKAVGLAAKAMDSYLKSLGDGA